MESSWRSCFVQDIYFLDRNEHLSDAVSRVLAVEGVNYLEGNTILGGIESVRSVNNVTFET